MINDICPKCGAYGEPKIFLSKYRGWCCDGCFDYKAEMKHNLVVELLGKYLSLFYDDASRSKEINSIICECFDLNGWSEKNCLTKD